MQTHSIAHPFIGCYKKLYSVKCGEFIDSVFIDIAAYKFFGTKCRGAL